MNEKLTAFLISMAFNVYWLLCVLLQNSAWPLLLVILLIAIIYQRSLLWRAPLIAVIGLGIDIIFTGLGWYQFTKEMSDLDFFVRIKSVPLWLCFLWLGFACYMWLVRDLLLKYPPTLVAVIFSISGMTSYHAAARLGAVEFPDSLFMTCILLAVWLVYGFLFTFLLSKMLHLQIDTKQALCGKSVIRRH